MLECFRVKDHLISILLLYIEAISRRWVLLKYTNVLQILGRKMDLGEGRMCSALQVENETY